MRSTSSESKTPFALKLLVVAQGLFIIVFTAVAGYSFLWSTPNYIHEMNAAVGRIDLSAGVVTDLIPYSGLNEGADLYIAMALTIIDESLYHIDALRAPLELREQHEEVLQLVYKCKLAVTMWKNEVGVSQMTLQEISKECNILPDADVAY